MTFFFLLFELWKLGTHHWVFTIALWLRLAGGWLVPALCGVSPGRFTVVAEQSLYKQTKWMICKLAHEKSDRAHARTQTRTYLHLGQYSHTLIVQSGCLHKRKRGEAIQWHHLLVQAQRCPVIVDQWQRRVISAGKQGVGGLGGENPLGLLS